MEEAQHLDCLWQQHVDLVAPSVSRRARLCSNQLESSCYLPPVATINSILLPVPDYPGSRVTCRNTLDDKLTARVVKAGAAFGQLSKLLWSDHRVGVRLDTKI